MKYFLVIYSLSTGYWQDPMPYLDPASCNEAIMELEHNRGPDDIWSAVCTDELHHVTAITAARDIGP